MLYEIAKEVLQFRYKKKNDALEKGKFTWIVASLGIGRHIHLTMLKTIDNL